MSRPSNLAEWIILYERKVEPFTLANNSMLWATNEHGFVQVELFEGALWLRQVCCDVWFYKPMVVEYAKKHNCSHIMFTTKRNPKAMARATGFKYTGKVFNDGFVLSMEVC